MLSFDTRSPAPRSSFFFFFTVVTFATGLTAGAFVPIVFAGNLVAGDIMILVPNLKHGVQSTIVSLDILSDVRLR